MGQHEQPLTGGNVTSGVVCVGDTLRRPAGPWTPYLQAPQLARAAGLIREFHDAE